MTTTARLNAARALLDTPPPAAVPGQLTIPDAALAVIEAALDDADQNGETHRTRARRIAEELHTAGWLTTPPSTRRPDMDQQRARCPHCRTLRPINTNGRIRRHGPHGHPCHGSGALAALHAPAA